MDERIDRLIAHENRQSLGFRGRHMSFHLRHIFNIEVAAITVIILSVALIVYVVLSLSDIIGLPE